MDDIENIQFEERNVYPAVTWGIISFIYVGISRYLMKIDCSIYADPDGIKDFGLLTALGFIYFSNWAIYIAITVWVVRIARKLNRSTFFWGILGFLFAPVTLIVIGFMDYKIADKNVKKIVDELRIDFNSELFHIKSTKDLSEKEMNEVEIKLKEKFKQKLKDRIAESQFKDRITSFYMTEQDTSEKQNNIEAEEDEVVQSVTDQHWTGETNKCPACGAPFGDNAVSCPECGLTIKQDV